MVVTVGLNLWRLLHLRGSYLSSKKTFQMTVMNFLIYFLQLSTFFELWYLLLRYDKRKKFHLLATTGHRYKINRLPMRELQKLTWDKVKVVWADFWIWSLAVLLHFNLFSTTVNLFGAEILVAEIRQASKLHLLATTSHRYKINRLPFVGSTKANRRQS